MSSVQETAIHFTNFSNKTHQSRESLPQTNKSPTKFRHTEVATNLSIWKLMAKINSLISIIQPLIGTITQVLPVLLNRRARPNTSVPLGCESLKQHVPYVENRCIFTF